MVDIATPVKAYLLDLILETELSNLPTDHFSSLLQRPGNGDVRYHATAWYLLIWITHICNPKTTLRDPCAWSFHHAKM